MAAAQPVHSEVDKPEEEDPVKEVIRWVVKTLLQSGRRAGASDRNARVPQQFVSTPVESPLGAGGPTGRPGEICA